MGALCGKEDHFDQLGSKGNVLGSSPSAHPTSASTSGPKPATPAKPVKGASTSPPQKLGGEGPGLAGGAGRGPPDRDAVLKAAEARSKASATRGAPGGGKLASQLNKQSRDGGRADEARREAEQRGEPLVWD
ncbi:hypothetical protein JCM1841_003088 [Sporobolomyces salmonicolor]